MKLIYIFIILVFSFLSCKENVKTTSKTPEIIPTLKKSVQPKQEIISPEIKMLKYLTNNFHKLPDSTLIKKPEWMIDETNSNINCGYIVQFEEGHSFKHEEECVEWGEIVTVEFKDYSKEDVMDLVERLYINDNYSWYENETEYRPQQDYETIWTFKIQENGQNPKLSFAYSWL